MADDATLHVPLSQPPQAISLTVRQLLQRVQSGGVRVPAFQRPLRWRAADVVMLFDSVLRGYPVGSLLFWKQSAPAEPNYRIGGARIALPAYADAWLIVDGQQRVTALAAALLELDHDADGRWVVRFDPATRTFLPGPVPPEERGRVVPLPVLGDLRRLGRWLRDSSLDEALQTLVEEVQQRILDYPLSAYLMETNEEPALRGVFARLNSTGVRMRSDEVFQALLGSRPGGGGALDLDSLQRACDVDSFGLPPRTEILKAVLAISGHDPTRRLEDLGEDAASRLADPEEAREALLRAVAFLQSPVAGPEPGAGIPCYSLIPYPVAFVLLARWFFVFPEPEPGIRQELGHWLWRGVLSATHQRAAVSQLRLQVRLIRGDSPEAAVDRLLGAVGGPARVDWALEKFNASNARSRVEILALLSCQPRDREGPVSWRQLMSGGERLAREIIATGSWGRLGEADRRLARGAANRAILDARHSGLKAELRQWDPERDREALASHLIDREMWDDLCREDYASFLRRRGPQVQALVSRFLTPRGGLGAPRLRALTSYLDLEPEESEIEEPEVVDRRGGGAAETGSP